MTQWVGVFDEHTTHGVVVTSELEQAGMLVGGCPMLLLVEADGCSGGTLATFMVLSEGLPIPGIDFFEDFPLLTLAVAANFDLSKFLMSSFRRTQDVSLLLPVVWY